MSSVGSMVARQGSAGSSIAGSVDQTSHNHFISRFFSTLHPPSTLRDDWELQNHRHERIGTGTMRMGMAVLTREMMEMHVHQAPDVRGMLDCLPVANPSNTVFIGWRQKLGTWPNSKRHSSPRRRYD